MHYFQKISLRGFDDEMIVIIHENITVDENSVATVIIIKDCQELFSIPIIKEDFLPLIASTGDVIKSPIVFYSKRPSHEQLYIKIR